MSFAPIWRCLSSSSSFNLDKLVFHFCFFCSHGTLTNFIGAARLECGALAGAVIGVISLDQLEHCCLCLGRPGSQIGPDLGEIRSEGGLLDGAVPLMHWFT